MGSYHDPTAGQAEDERLRRDIEYQQDAEKQIPLSLQARYPYQSQFKYLTRPQRQSNPPSLYQYGSVAFDMAAAAGAIPQSGHITSAYHNAQYQSLWAPLADLSVLRAQSQPLVPQQHQARQLKHPLAHYQPGLVLQPPTQYPYMDMYAYAMDAPHVSLVGPWAGPQAFARGGSTGGEMTQFSRRFPEPVPSFPRGPPRKPKQSGHALWVGNLPPAATVTNLKDHFSQDATKDIESLFLISKSKCAFVNYRTAAACVAAMNRFHDSRFHGVRLVCRPRRGSAASTSSPLIGQSTTDPLDGLPDGLGTSADPTDPSDPVIVGESRAGEATKPAGEVETNIAASPKVPEKFFIVKSLTEQDLEASVRNGTWATQSHNEQTLNAAFEAADNVYLIFSANKSGEYFGYARMASRISGEAVNLNSFLETDGTKLSGTPQSISTPATETAPKGRIIDDLARGTIFWEAELSDNEADSPIKNDEGSDRQHWGWQFKIVWLSTSRLPFFRTRGLRNPWNANKEIKIARDGTELEPSVGRRLVQMFHRPPPAHGGAVLSPTQYR
ncbi:hypothetical protein LTR85_011618 [Meristemomyces frigidus]|nr:hypothetical protein LTR85_011618 [Meristemomyces frigidus]